jgi:pimeloyl-ACP methyl ester carboxylesterase
MNLLTPHKMSGKGASTPGAAQRTQRRDESLFLLLLFWFPSLKRCAHPLLLLLGEDDQYHPAGFEPPAYR